MPLPNIFSADVANEIIHRINKLTPESQPKWGKMNVAQMLAHCNDTYEMVYEDKHPKPGFIMSFILKRFIKKTVVGEGMYKQNLQTAPAFVMKETKNFEEERSRLISYISTTQKLGETAFDNKASHSFGILNKEEWNNMFYKHLNHHLIQCGV